METVAIILASIIMSFTQPTSNAGISLELTPPKQEQVVIFENFTPVTESAATASYTEEDVYWLSRLIFAEAGSEDCSDLLQLYVGSVALNRVNHHLYPDTIYDVIFDTHWGIQYACSIDGNIWKEPDTRAINNAIYILENGSILPENVLGQSAYVTLNGMYTEVDGVIFSYY